VGLTFTADVFIEVRYDSGVVTCVLTVFCNTIILCCMEYTYVSVHIRKVYITVASGVRNTGRWDFTAISNMLFYSVTCCYTVLHVVIQCYMLLYSVTCCYTVLHALHIGREKPATQQNKQQQNQQSVSFTQTTVS